MAVHVKFTGKNAHLGDFSIESTSFPGLRAALDEWSTEAFSLLSEKEKSDRLNRKLLSLILSAKETVFLLPAVIDFLDVVSSEKIIEHYNFSGFELWLNQFSGLTAEENYRVRARIAGKWVPRDAYQVLFPIGMNKTYPGSHFVTAHSSPDLDTTIASFWGWLDAFAARVSAGLHIWNVPGGIPTSTVETTLLFTDIFGQGIGTHLVKERSALAISSVDLMSQKGLVEWNVDDPTSNVRQSEPEQAVILVDQRGYYLGDWRDYDAESVRQATMLVSSCLRWFQTEFQVRLVSLFSKPQLVEQDATSFIKEIFSFQFRECDPVKEMTSKQKMQTDEYFKHVFSIRGGLHCTFENFAKAMDALKLREFHEFVSVLEKFPDSLRFNTSKEFIEDRPHLFQSLDRVIKALHQAIFSLRLYVDRLDVAVGIKAQVFNITPHIISYRAELDEIKSRIGQYSYLTVTQQGAEGKLIPWGVVHASDLLKPILGTVTLRDFCNREETKIPSYLEVISVIDHHKSSLQTSSPPMAIISDAQSVNVLVAELSFAINDRFSTGGMTLQEIDLQIQEMERNLSTPSQKRIFQRLLQRQMVASRSRDYFVDASREFIEYLHFLYGILDDTDLLTKVTSRDLICVASLLNRLKSLMLKKEVEIIHFDGLDTDGDGVEKMASVILQNSDLYSLCRKTYASKEQNVEENIHFALEGKPSTIFLDTKEQNGCCRIGQTKLFARNFEVFAKHVEKIRAMWIKDAMSAHLEKPEVDLHLHMVSTIAGAEDLFAGTGMNYSHKDELWIWIPSGESAIAHLKSFLGSFRTSPAIVENQKENELELEFIGPHGKQLSSIFEESFLSLPHHFEKQGAHSIIVLRFKAGSLNSRKSMVSPFLPRLIS